MVFIFLSLALVYKEAWQCPDASVLTKYLFYRFLAPRIERGKKRGRRISFTHLLSVILDNLGIFLYFWNVLSHLVSFFRTRLYIASKLGSGANTWPMFRQTYRIWYGFTSLRFLKSHRLLAAPSHRFFSLFFSLSFFLSSFPFFFLSFTIARAKRISPGFYSRYRSR